MPQIVDQFGNPFRGFLDTVGGEVVTETGRTYTTALSSNGAEIIMDLNGAATASFDVRATAANLTYVIQGSTDGNNYDALPMFAVFQSLAGVLVAETYVSSV